MYTYDDVTVFSHILAQSRFISGRHIRYTRTHTHTDRTNVKVLILTTAHLEYWLNSSLIPRPLHTVGELTWHCTNIPHGIDSSCKHLTVHHTAVSSLVCKHWCWLLLQTQIRARLSEPHTSKLALHLHLSGTYVLPKLRTIIYIYCLAIIF